MEDHFEDATLSCRLLQTHRCLLYAAFSCIIFGCSTFHLSTHCHKKSGVRSIPKNPTLAQLVAGFEGVLDLLDWWLEKYILTHRIHVWVGDLNLHVEASHLTKVKLKKSRGVPNFIIPKNKASYFLGWAQNPGEKSQRSQIAHVVTFQSLRRPIDWSCDFWGKKNDDLTK